LDGQIWKYNNLWDQLIGGQTGGQKPQGAAWLWTSSDLKQWTLQKNIAPSIKKSRYWELPYLIELDGKYVLFVGSGNPYWLGDFDYKTMIFTPDSEAPQSVDSGYYYSFNINMTDDRGPAGHQRQLMHGWVRMKRPPKVPNVPWW
jgi:sucrose-6-phosphate hydrolase SacC (GH32 family)